jgi:membrane-associated protease RseP (regulator of RpoE activity)
MAYQPGSPPTYFYSLFKTTDGEMRAFVRPDGPAYFAGMRTNDIIEKVDGKFWWEYGTFQTQRFAHDGNAHMFLVRRPNAGEANVDLALVRPFFEARPAGRGAQTP